MPREHYYKVANPEATHDYHFFILCGNKTEEDLLQTDMLERRFHSSERTYIGYLADVDVSCEECMALRTIHWMTDGVDKPVLIGRANLRDPV